MKRNKVVFGILTEDRSIGASMLAALAQDHDWEVDIAFFPPEADKNRVQNCVAELKPDVFALSFRSYERKQAFEIASITKKMGVKVIGGGTHPTLLPLDCIQSGHFDAIVQGDGMGVLEQILDDYKSLKDNQLIVGQKHPDKHVYLRYFFSDSQKAVMKKTHSVNMMTSIGCPFSCTYCGSSRLQYLKISAQDIVDVMVEFAQNYGVKIFVLQDDLLCASVKRVRRISELLEERLPGQGVGFGKSINTRASDFSEELAAELVRLGITDVSFGIESASTKLLKFLNKKQTEEDCYRAIEICRQFGLYSRIHLMFGIPTQDREDYETTLKFVKNAKPNIVNLFYYSPYPGTDLYDYCFKHNQFPATFDRNRFDWFDPALDGIRSIQVQLKDVDYDMATNYMARINKIYDINNFLRPLLNEVDQYSWVLIGTSVQVYFSQVLQHLKKYYTFKNCWGYWDIDPTGSYPIERLIKYHQYNPEIGRKPVSFVTYCHISNRDYQNLKNLIHEKFGNVPLISISTMERHTVEEVRQMLNKNFGR